jgi:hypothetical protein
MYKWHKDNVPNPTKTRYDPANAEWYKARNKQFLIDEKVHTWRELQEMYGLSQGRIRDLKNKYSNKFLGV